MKKLLSFFICITCIFSIFSFSIKATEQEFTPYVIDFSLKPVRTDSTITESDSRATGLINSYSLSLSSTGTTLNIYGLTNGSTEVIKCGFKNLIIQRRLSSNYSWEEYYDYGNIYIDGSGASLNTKLVVESGYQYRISCKHYAKKNILSVQTIANTSNIVTVS